MARYREATVAALLAKRSYSLHRNEKGKYTLIDPAGRIIREKMEALDLVILVYSKAINESYYTLLEDLDCLPPPPPTPAEELARTKLAKKRKEEKQAKEKGKLYPLVPCPACSQIRHQKDSARKSYKCLSCGLKFTNGSSSASSEVKKQMKGRSKIKDGRPNCSSCLQDTLVRQKLDSKRALMSYRCKPCALTIKVSIDQLDLKRKK